MRRESWQDNITQVVIYVILVVISLIVIVPILYTISVSLTPYADTLKRGGVILWPTNITFEYYGYVFNENSPVPRAYLITGIVTVIGTAISLLITAFTAYPLSKRYLPGRNGIMWIFFFTMLFGGGLIPTYLVIRSLGLINTLWALMIPSAMSVYNMIIMRTFFSGIPDSLEESAKLDGANDITILFRIVLPLSMPVLATLGLFYAVGKWNMFFDALIYINDRSKYTLQVVLREILLMSQLTELIPERASALPPQLPLQMATTMVAVIPMLCLYPFLQRYFVQGVMIGAIKG
ncbi:carbohydrate ABC transporter permease [Mahella sp.]|uniref:carbohydrate ABC transporter permease n=1 Tax=Mahella sp. TaxID=2798721 RepID=UPI0025BD8A58|nr:carbohydrate ABC transporter permease [Mahella sp.]MBZ4665626.1 binding-protein-dependent transport system inner rane component [Mahella sp.]